MPYFDIAMLLIGVTLFSKGARMDGKSPLLWGSLSMLAWVVTFFVLGGGWIRWMAGQAGVFAALTAWNLQAAGRDHPPAGPA